MKSLGDEYDEIISEIAQGAESDVDADRMFLRSAVRQIKEDALKQELMQLSAAGLTPESIARFREITAQQAQLEREKQAEFANR